MPREEAAGGDPGAEPLEDEVGDPDPPGPLGLIAVEPPPPGVLAAAAANAAEAARISRAPSRCREGMVGPPSPSCPRMAGGRADW